MVSEQSTLIHDLRERGLVAVREDSYWQTEKVLRNLRRTARNLLAPYPPDRAEEALQEALAAADELQAPAEKSSA